MLAKSAISVFIIFFLECYSFRISESKWTSLRVTYGINIFSSTNFAKLPRQESKARTQDFIKIPGECKDGKFLGLRYMKGNDPTVVTIYDVNGYIAGLQHGIPKRDVDRVSPTYPYSQSTAYQLDVIKGEEIYFLTAYFVDPAIICEGGRSESDFEENGTGTGLYLQNGENPIRDTTQVPFYEEEAIYNTTGWVKGECKRGMGLHYWYDYSSNMDCSTFFPFTLIYNRGKITSFAFVNFGYFDFSSRFEHPSKSSLSGFLTPPIPKCVEDEYDISGGFSTMHVLFSIRPWDIFC